MVVSLGLGERASCLETFRREKGGGMLHAILRVNIEGFSRGKGLYHP